MINQGTFPLLSTQVYSNHILFKRESNLRKEYHLSARFPKFLRSDDQLDILETPMHRVTHLT